MCACEGDEGRNLLDKIVAWCLFWYLALIVWCKKYWVATKDHMGRDEIEEELRVQYTPKIVKCAEKLAKVILPIG